MAQRTRDTKNKHSTNASGFTRIELAVTIVVLGILATIGIVAYGAWQQEIGANVLESDLKQASAHLEDARTWQDGYPALDASGTSLPASDGTSYQYLSTGNTYCLSATSERDGVPDRYISNTDDSPQEGVCSGHYASDQVVTVASCFGFNSGSGTITAYYEHEGGGSSGADCPRDVVIPSSIGGVEVTELGDYSMNEPSIGRLRLDSVVIPATVTRIGDLDVNHLLTIAGNLSDAVSLATAFHDAVPIGQYHLSGLEGISDGQRPHIGLDEVPVAQRKVLFNCIQNVDLPIILETRGWEDIDKWSIDYDLTLRHVQG